ncbi:MAG: hypothetical protein HYX32_01260 [Actinobacteria bacterium]|nr:hypothetical protein [Actinomycetota bacterium]
MSTSVPEAQPRALDHDRLEQLALVLVSDLDASPDPAPEVLAVGILPPEPDKLAVAIRPLEGADPVASIIGFKSPADWLATGIVATGRWSAMSDAEAASGTIVRRSRRKPEGRIRMAHFVTRAGAVLAVMSKDGARPEAHWPDPGGQYGRADDVCRRILGVPTAPPNRDVRELWALVWCDVIVERVLNGAPPAWPEIASAHPAIGQLGTIDAATTAWAVDNLVGVGDEYASLHPWDELRQLCARNEWPVTGIDPEHAAWMDDGMFSRWAAEPYPELSEMLDDLAVLLPPESAYRVWRTVDAWGLP